MYYLIWDMFFWVEIVVFIFIIVILVIVLSGYKSNVYVLVDVVV